MFHRFPLFHKDNMTNKKKQQTPLPFKMIESIPLPHTVEFLKFVILWAVNQYKKESFHARC